MSDILYDAILGSMTLRQVTSATYSSGATTRQAYGSGGFTPQQIFGVSTEPTATFSTLDLAGVVGGVSPTAGLSITNGITLAYQRAVNQGLMAAAAATEHAKLSCTNGLVVAESISADQGGDATANLKVHFRSTDGSDPMNLTVNQTLESTGFNSVYALGPVSLTVDGGTEAAIDVASISVTTSVSVPKRRDNSLSCVTKIFLTQSAPAIDLRFFDIESLLPITAAFKKLGNISCYLRKRADGGEFVPDSTPEHIKLSFAAGIIEANNVEASDVGDATINVRIYGKVLAWSATNAIPAIPAP